MRRRADGISHVVEAVEERHEIVVVPGIIPGVGHFESNIREVLFAREDASPLNRRRVGVEPDKL